MSTKSIIIIIFGILFITISIIAYKDNQVKILTPPSSLITPVPFFDKEIFFEPVRGDIFFDRRAQPGKYLIKSEGEWVDFGFSPSQIDFSKNSLVVILAGGKPTGGYRIRVTKIIERSQKLTVFVEEESPGKGCPVTQAFTAPYQVVKIPKTDKEAEFVVTQVVKQCFRN